MIEVARGRLSKQIAGDIGIAASTVKVHRSRAMRKMNARSLPESAEWPTSSSSCPKRRNTPDDQGLEWFEEPIVFDDFTGSARLANGLKTPVQIAWRKCLGP